MSYLIIGGTGSLGKKLIERLTNCEQVAVYSRDEAKHWTIKNEVSENQRKFLNFFVGDIRDKLRLKDVMWQFKPTTVIIAAALKQVDTCELSPNESVATNLQGTQNVIDVFNELRSLSITGQYKFDVKEFTNLLFVSTDKACAPVNVYGMCKAISERLVTSQSNTQDNGSRYMAVRYGNVLESRGSIIPLFKYQSEHNSVITVTDPEMTRYVMTLDDSVDLILKTLKDGKNGETWIPRLPAMKIGDLAEIFSELSNKPIKIIGLRPGEKKHEDLINESESVRTYLSVSQKNYVISSAMSPQTGDRFTYSSNDLVMSKIELKKHLEKLGILMAPLNSFIGKSIEEITTNKGDKNVS